MLCSRRRRDFPVWLYNLPKFANNNLSAALVTRLARRYENCVGLKDSSGDLMTMCAVNHLQDGRFNTAIGPDNLILAGLALGLDCSVSGNCNHFPEIVVGIHEAFHAGDMASGASFAAAAQSGERCGRQRWLVDGRQGHHGRARLAGRWRTRADVDRERGDGAGVCGAAARAQGRFERGVVGVICHRVHRVLRRAQRDSAMNSALVKGIVDTRAAKPPPTHDTLRLVASASPHPDGGTEGGLAPGH